MAEHPDVADVTILVENNDFRAQWIDDRTSYDHHAAFGELFKQYHIKIARAKKNMLPGDRSAHRAVGPQNTPNTGHVTGHVMWECPHTDCSKTHPYPFRDADR